MQHILLSGVIETPQYNAFKFHGGEVHFKMKEPLEDKVKITSKITNSDELILLLIVIDTLKKDGVSYIELFIPYMPYQQADRDFSVGESFSLKTITNILNGLEINKISVFDAHSDVSTALLKNCKNIDTSDVIKEVIKSIISFNRFRSDKIWVTEKDLCILSPDAGAYKKIGKLCSKIGWKGDLVAANKYRSISSGTIESLELSKQDFEGKDVLIIDDICVGGRTFTELSKKLKEKNCGRVYLYISHGIFSNGLAALNPYFDRIFVTNSRKDFLLDEEFLNNNEFSLNKLTVLNII